MNITNRTLSQIVTDNFQTASVFEKYGLDFCCKGKRTLQDACSERGIPIEQLVQELSACELHDGPAIQFDKLTLPTLVDYIVSVHHSYVKHNLPQILSYALKIATKHGDQFPYMKKVYILFAQVNTELTHHLRQEEQLVFPAIKGIAANPRVGGGVDLDAVIKMMEEEHETAGELMHKIRVITNDYATPDNVCTTFRLTMHALRSFESDLHQHVHLENHILFPKALHAFRQRAGAGEAGIY